METLKHFKLLWVMALWLAAASPAFAQAEAISPERKMAIDSLALEKVRDLSTYIRLIGDKATPWSEANRVIERAVELFMEGSRFGVSNVADGSIVNYPVRTYLERLLRLNYDRVEIDWFDIQYVSDLELQPDGRYVGVITVFQRFSAYSDETGLVYRDQTQKDITIYVERKETQIGGRVIGFWDVMLGDVRVKETIR